MGLPDSLFFDRLYVLPDKDIALQLVHFAGNPLQHLIGYFFHSDQQGDRSTLTGQFIGHRWGPKPIGKIVVLQGTEPLYGAQSAMVVGQDQTFL